MRKRLLPLLSTGLFRGLGAVSQFLLAWWISGLLSKDLSGIVFLYLACHTVLSPVVLMGTQYFGMRQISQFDESEHALIRDHAHQAARLSLAAILMSLLFLLVVVLAFKQAFAGASWFSDWSGMLLPLVFASASGAVSLAVASHLHGLKRFGQSIFYSHINIPLLTIVIMAALQPVLPQEVFYCHLAACLMSASMACVIWVFYFSLPKASDPRVSYRSARAASFNFWLITCCNLSITWFPIIIGGVLVEAEQVAELNIGQRAANLINFVLVIVTFAFAPRLRRAWAESDLIGLRHDTARCAIMLISIGTFAFLTIFVAAEHVVGLFGPEYVSGATVLRIFAAAQYFSVITGSVNQILMMWGHERTLRSIFLASAIACFVLSTGLGMAFGAIGIASGAAIALCFHNILAVSVVKMNLGFWVFDPRQPAVASTAV